MRFVRWLLATIWFGMSALFFLAAPMTLIDAVDGSLGNLVEFFLFFSDTFICLLTFKFGLDVMTNASH